MEKASGIHADAVLPPFASNPLKRRFKHQATINAPLTPQPGTNTTGKVLLFGTCYGHNQMPELGDLDSVNTLKQHNLPRLAAYVDEGYDIVAPVPSCVLMFKQELRLIFPTTRTSRKS
jgi:glycerol-3-phosphate dehydrogenase subunit C